MFSVVFISKLKFQQVKGLQLKMLIKTLKPKCKKRHITYIVFVNILKVNTPLSVV